MESELKTERLLLQTLKLEDASFIRELVNTEGWLRFIGQRNVHSQEQAEAYVRRIINAKELTYWVVRLKETNKPIGIISLIKRDYLDFHDIGFAFLPGQQGKGYAYEAAKAVIENLRSSGQHPTLLATTLPHNISSIQLLKKLGFLFQREISIQNEIVHLFSNTTDASEKR